jgi:hypothetical protein
MVRIVERRQAALQHRLCAAEAALPVDDDWLADRVERYATIAGVAARLVLDPVRYAASTGRGIQPGLVGEADYAVAGRRRQVAIVFLNPARLPDRGYAETVIAHELGHVRAPSLGHRRQFFVRVQRLLDAAVPPG